MPIDQAGPPSSNPRRLPRPKKKKKVTLHKRPFEQLGINMGRNPYEMFPNIGPDKPKYTGPLSGSMKDRNPLDKFDTPAERAARRNYNPPPKNASSSTKLNYNNVPAIHIPGTDAGGIGGVDSRGVGQNGTIAMVDQVLQKILSDSSSSSFDYEHALQQSQRAIRRAYGAEIGAVRSNNKAATRETRRDRKQLEAMYDGLARSYGQAAHQAQVNANQGARAQTTLANEANKTIKANQGANTKEEANLIKGLGLQSTAKDIIDPDFKEVTKVQAENTQTGARKAGLQKEFGGINRDFMVQGGLSSRMEGTNRSADLLTGLEDYIRQNRNQIAILAGKRGQDLAQNRISTMSAASEAQADAQQNQYDTVLKYLALRGQLGDTDVDNALAAAQFQDKQGVERQNFGLKANQQTFDQGIDISKLDQGQQKINQSAAQKKNSYLPKELQASMSIIHDKGQKEGQLTNILQALFNSKQYRTGKVVDKNDTTKFNKLTPAEAANMAERAARQAGLSPHDIQVARLAAWASVK